MNKTHRIDFAVMLTALLAGCCDRDADRNILDAQTDFYCPTSSKVSYEPWSECGLMKVCIDPGTKKKNGSQFAAQGGKMRSKALYTLGNEVGGWTEYDSNGNTEMKIGGYKAPAW